MTPASFPVAAGSDERPWPAPDTVVLRNRPLYPGTELTSLARFADDSWALNPAHPDAHLSALNLRWVRYPDNLILPFKTFALAVLDHPYPAVITQQRLTEYASPTTLHSWFLLLRGFAAWLDDRGLDRLCDVGDRELDAYRTHVLELTRSTSVKASLLQAVLALWAYREHLPAPCRLAATNPWSGTTPARLVDKPKAGKVNKTPRIAPDTMEALLLWSLRMIEDIGPDIRDAWLDYRQLDARTHPSQHAFAELTIPDRITLFATRARADHVMLPGRPGPEPRINWYHLGRLLGIPPRDRGNWSTDIVKRLVAEQFLPVADDTYIGSITGTVEGKRWRENPMTTTELPRLVIHLYAAAAVIICYLSGMRPGENLSLRKGCRDTDLETGELLLRGHRSKGYDRSPLETTTEPRRPWVVVQPVHQAVAMLESLSHSDFLFPASTVFTGTRRSTKACLGSKMNADLRVFAAWVNQTWTRADGPVPIPHDPTGLLHAARFRRTLAYFIVRRPRGLIAAALQYGHVQTKVTLNYAGEADNRWMDDLAVERLEMLLEQNETDSVLLRDGEHVSGPSAEEYRRRVNRATAFSGRVVTTVRSTERLLAQANPDIHHGEGMSCVYRVETAACRTAKIELGLPATNIPDESECRSTCSNLAYTDRNIAWRQAQLARLDAAANDSLAPRPIRDRAAALASQVRAIIAQHEASRAGDIPNDGTKTP